MVGSVPEQIACTSSLAGSIEPPSPPLDLPHQDLND